VVDHPIGCLFEPVHLSNPAAAVLPRTYILHTEGLRFFAERVLATGGAVHELVTAHGDPVGHYSMFTAPQELAALLSPLAQPDG
jgi:hypothetical protein